MKTWISRTWECSFTQILSPLCIMYIKGGFMGPVAKYCMKLKWFLWAKFTKEQFHVFPPNNHPPHLIIWPKDDDTYKVLQMGSKTLWSTGKSLSNLLFLHQLTHNIQKNVHWFTSFYMKTTSSEHVVYINCFECENKKMYSHHSIISTVR